MRFWNFTSFNVNFSGGFSGGSSAEIPSILWNVGTYKLRGSLATTSESSPTGMWFKPDGTKVFIVGQTQDRLKSWDLTTAWDISTATNFTNMASVLQNTSGVALTVPTGVAFSNDGTKAFVTDATSNALYRYSLTTAWDITTLNVLADQVNTTIYTSNLAPQSIWVRPDGLLLTTANSSPTSQYRNWTTTVANDITTLTAGDSASGGSIPVGAVWADNGNKFVYVLQATDEIFAQSYTSPYTFVGNVILGTRVMTPEDTSPQDVYMKNDGTSFYYLGSGTDTIYQFSL
jgi:hypothetical protein